MSQPGFLVKLTDRRSSTFPHSGNYGRRDVMVPAACAVFPRACHREADVR